MEIPDKETLLELWRGEEWTDFQQDDATATLARDAVRNILAETETMLTPDNITIYSANWLPNDRQKDDCSTARLATVGAVGCRLEHDWRCGHYYYLVDQPPRGFVLLVARNAKHAVHSSVGHELAHAEDWLDRQKTCESDETFVERCKKFGGAHPKLGV